MTLDPVSADALLERAREAYGRAMATGRPVLFEAQWPVSGDDVLNLVYQASALADDGERLPATFYWAQPTREIEIAGLGELTRLTGNGADAALQLRRQIRVLDLDRVLASTAPAWARPRWLGGLSFNVARGQNLNGIWTGFPPALLVRPRLQLVRNEVYVWMTVAELVTRESDPQAVVDTITTMRNRVLDWAKAAYKRRYKPASSSSKAPIESGMAFQVLPPVTPTAQATTHSTEPLSDDARASRPRPQGQGQDRAAFTAAVTDAVAAIRNGEMKKVVLARGVSTTTDVGASPCAILDSLRQHHAGSTIFLLQPPGAPAFLGATPERLVELERGRIVASALAGTAPRGLNATEDAMHARAMSESAKEQEEHRLVVESIHDAIEPMVDGEVDVNGDPTVLVLPHVQHLMTTVRATAKPDVHILDLVGALHPTPAVGGLPRDRALAFMRTHETIDRGYYAAPIGHVDGNGDGEFAVAIRSALVTPTRAHLFAGAGIVAGSQPDRELAETDLKLRVLESALVRDTATADKNA